jgi:hypothetical protein
MATKIEEAHRKEIDNALDSLDRNVHTCSKAAFEDALILGRHFYKFRQGDLDKIFAATHTFYKKCVCTKKQE